MRCASPGRRGAPTSLLALLCLAVLSPLGSEQSAGQVIQDVSLTPFVIAFVPVVGRGGAVGGVAVDAEGVVARAAEDAEGRLSDAWRDALQEVPSDVNRQSTMRKISLRRLEAEIVRLRDNKLRVSDELQFLAGMQRLRYLFVYPQQRDIVLAGYAEGWEVDDKGNVVGRTTGRPVLHLADLVVALRSAEPALKTGISCSIDPTPEGVARLQRAIAAPGLKMTDATVRRLENELGPQTVTVTGVPPTSHFARVMLAADYQMKRLAMDFEKPPVRGMPSYLYRLKLARSIPREMMPRWWLAPDYEPLLRDADGLAWQLRGGGVRAMTEDGFLAAAGVQTTGKSSPLAQAWAESMTRNYEALSQKMPVFAELRNCMDLAVVASLILKHRLDERAGYAMPLLMDPKQVAVPETFAVPRTVDSQASFVKIGRNWVVSVSGGIEVDGWNPVEKAEQSAAVGEARSKAAPAANPRWWWD